MNDQSSFLDSVGHLWDSFKMDAVTVARLHAACKIIEYDGMQGYYTVKERYGENIANALIVMWLRRQLNPTPDQYPCPEDLPAKVNEMLRKVRILKPASTHDAHEQ